MFTWIAGLGLKALAGSALKSAGGGIARGWRWLAGCNFYQLGCIALALFAGWQTVGRWSQHRHTVKVEAQLASAITARDAARANEAVLKAALAKQSAAVAALGAKSAAEQQIAAKASQAAAERAGDAQATSERLKASSRVAPAPAASGCEPSETLKEQWR